MKTLIVYYSYTGNTKKIANAIKNNLNCDILEVTPKIPFSNDYDEVVAEYQNNSIKDKSIEINDIEIDLKEYYKIIIGSPVWWGTAAWPVNTFVKENNFDGKTVIPFCTSASSSLGESGKLLQKEAASENWQSGNRFSSSATDADIKTFTDSIK